MFTLKNIDNFQYMKFNGDYPMMSHKKIVRFTQDQYNTKTRGKFYFSKSCLWFCIRNSKSYMVIWLISFISSSVFARANIIF